MDVPPGARPCPDCSYPNPSGQAVCGRCGKDLAESLRETLTAPPPQPAARPDPLSFAPGERFGRRYVIVEEIGRGGMGRVYKARDTELDVEVALKMIRPERAGDPSFIHRFKQEALLGRAVSHENVIRLYDLGEVEGVKFISMEFVKGQNLAELIQASGKLSEETAVGLAAQVCRALAAAHKLGIAHRDLKPHNVLIDRKGLVRVADFGLAGSAEIPEGKSTTRPAGTPAYMSPEQVRGETTDSRSDIYSLGVMLYEMVAGRRPFQGKTAADVTRGHLETKPPLPSRHNPRLSPALEALILKCLEKDRTKRFQSAGEILPILERIGGTSRMRPKNLRRTAALAGGLVLALLAVSIILRFLVFKGLPPGRLPAEGRRITVAVMYFENDTGDPNLEYLRKTLATLIIQDLLSSRFIRVITGEQLFQIMEELHLSQSRTYSEKDLRLVAERAQAGYILHGSIARIADVFNIHALLHRVEAWEMKGSHSLRERGLEGINAMVDSLTLQVKRDLDITQKDIAADIDRDVEKITTRSPQALRLFWEGTELYQQRKFQESNEKLGQALAIDPEFALAYYRTALNYSYLRDTGATQENLEKARGLADRVSPRERYLIRGLYAALYGPTPVEAIKIYEEFLRQYPDDESGLIALAALYRKLEEWDRAEALFDKARRLNIYNDVSYVNLSHIAMALGRYDQARNLLEANRGVFSETNYHYFLAIVCLCRGQYEECLAESRALLAMDQTDMSSLLLQGHASALSGDLPSAEKAYRRVLENANVSGQISARRGLAGLALLRGRFQQSRGEIDRGLLLARQTGRKADEISFLVLSAYLDLRRNRLSQASASALEALRISRATADTDNEKKALHLAGWTQALLGRPAEAAETAEKLKNLVERTGNRRHKRYYHQLKGILAMERGEWDRAAMELDLAVSFLSAQHSINDEHALFLEIAARAYENKGDLIRAHRILEDIQALTTGRLNWGDIYVGSFLRRARLFRRQGQTARAREDYRIFLRLFKDAEPDVKEVGEAGEELRAMGEKPGPQPPAKSAGVGG